MSNFAEGRRNGVLVTIRYRYMVKNREYLGQENRAINGMYHEEQSALELLLQQYPVGGQVAVYYPRRAPVISALTPGGASVPKLITWAIISVVFLYGWYGYFTVPFMDR